MGSMIVHGAASLAEDKARLPALKSLLSRIGHLVLVVRRPDGLSLSDLRNGSAKEEEVDLVAVTQANFRSVELAHQTVFFGYSIMCISRVLRPG